jgi:ubiquinone/menaquinone biosynthesis C-methylase UbiE
MVTGGGVPELRAMTGNDAVREQFDRQADAYVASPGHARGDDLERVAAYAAPEPSMRALDIATGPGNTAARIAPHVAAVVAVDVAPAMVARAQRLFSERGLANALALVAEAERLPFPDCAFDLVLCRIAPHHFTDLPRAVAEVARVLAPGGAFVLEDSCSPDDRALGELIDRVECLRDPTHVHSLSEREWRELLAGCGLEVTRSEIHRKRHDVADWLERAGTPPDARAAVLEEFANASAAAAEHFAIALDGKTPLAYTDDKLILRAERG